MTTPTPDYRYKAKILRWVDGDTVWLSVDLGFRMSTINDFRLYGVDTPERGQLNHKEATALVNAAAPPGTEVMIDTYKAPDKYGRWLVEIGVDDGDFTVNQQLIEAGMAKAYFGRKK